MAQTSARRTWLLTALVALVVVVVAIVAFLALGGDDDSPTAAAPSASPSSAEPADPGATTPPPTEGTPASFCAGFVELANANATFASSLDATTGQALVDLAGELFTLPTPDGMSPGARAAYDALVAGSLPQVESAGVSIDVAPDPANDAEPDQAAFDEYLETNCPA